MRNFQFLMAFVAALAVSAGILPAVIRSARWLGAVDLPGGRRVHSGEIPRLGGIGIFLGFITGVGAALLLSGSAGVVAEPDQRNWYGAAVGAVLIFVFGLLDDVFQFRPHTKFLHQVVAVSAAVVGGLSIDAVTSPFGGTWDLGVLGPLVAFGWILVITNAFNLMDGLDGLAGGIAMIVTTTVASVALAMDRFAAVLMSIALAGALLGFLRYNFAPARIFMGDGGSQFLGYTLAIISMRGSQKGPTAVAILVPLLVLGLPLFDLATTVLRRARRNGEDEKGLWPIVVLRRIARADREHLHHNLLDLGLSPRRAVLFLYLIAALFALSAYFSVVQNSLSLAGLTLCLSLGCVILIKTVFFGTRLPSRSD